jgi:hypothetical protein
MAAITSSNRQTPTPLGFRVQGFWVHGSWSRVSGFGFREGGLLVGDGGHNVLEKAGVVRVPQLPLGLLLHPRMKPFMGGTTRAEDARGSPTQSHLSPSAYQQVSMPARDSRGALQEDIPAQGD